MKNLDLRLRPASFRGAAPAEGIDALLQAWRITPRLAAAIGAAAGLAPTTALASQASLQVAPQTSVRLAQAASPSTDALAALVGRRVGLTLAGGVVVTGELLSVSADQVLVAQEPSGELAVVDPASVASVRVLAPAGSPAAPITAGGTAQPTANSLSSAAPEPETENRSTGLMVAGIATTISGAAALLAFGVGAAVDATTYSSSCGSYGCYDYGGSWTSYMWPLAVAGGAMLSAGIPMWIIGGADVEVEPTLSLAPIGGRGRGFHGGLRFEF